LGRVEQKVRVKKSEEYLKVEERHEANDKGLGKVESGGTLMLKESIIIIGMDKIRKAEAGSA
jgi:hypothetical protein